MKKKIFSLILIVGIIAIGITGCGGNSTNNESGNNSSSKETAKNKTYGLGEAFVFNGLEITFDKNYSFTVINNKLSDHNGESVIKLGINVKNVSSEKKAIMSYDYKTYGAKNTQLDAITSVFDDGVNYVGPINPNESYKSYLYILYDGNGKYSIKFKNTSQELAIEFNVTR